MAQLTDEERHAMVMLTLVDPTSEGSRAILAALSRIDETEAKLTAALAKNVELACANQALKAGVRCLRDATGEASTLLRLVAGSNTAIGARGLKACADVATLIDAALAETADLAPAQEAVKTHSAHVVALDAVGRPVACTINSTETEFVEAKGQLHVTDVATCAVCAKAKLDTDKSPVSDE